MAIQHNHDRAGVLPGPPITEPVPRPDQPDPDKGDDVIGGPGLTPPAMPPQPVPGITPIPVPVPPGAA